jgi:hypothetical protein
MNFFRSTARVRTEDEMRELSHHETERIRDLIRFARQRVDVYGQSEASSFYCLSMNADDREAFDSYLVALNHPLAMQPGTGEWRFRSYVVSR